MGGMKVAGAKLSEQEFARFETYASARNMSISAVLKLCINSLLSGEIDVERGELKIEVNHDGYAVFDDSETPFGQKIEKRLDKLRERGYPENFIYSMKEQILSGIDSQIDMLPKKFDSRRMRNNDCGC